MPNDTWKTFEARVTKFEKSFSPEARSRLALEVAKLSVIDQRAVVAGSKLGGDLAFTGGPGKGSGWRTKSGGLIKVETITVPSGPGEVRIAPARGTGGLWTVANTGSKGYAKGDRRVSGSRVVKKTGARVAKTRRVGHGTGATGGWGVQDAAVAVVEAKAPQRIAAAILKARVQAFD
jgi:hypothetical protein